MPPLTARTRPPAGEPEGASSCSTGAARTSTTSTRCSTCSTRSSGCSASRRRPLCSCRREDSTGTGWAASPHPIPRRSTAPCRCSRRCSRSLPVPLDRVVLGGFSQGAVMSWAMSLGPDRPGPAGGDRAVGLPATGRRLAADARRPRGLPRADRTRVARPGDRGRLRPRGTRRAHGGRRGRDLAREPDAAHDRPGVRPGPAGLRPAGARGRAARCARRTRVRACQAGTGVRSTTLR